MSVLGDINNNPNGSLLLTTASDRLTPKDVVDKKIGRIAIPLLIVQAFDDPVSTWRNVAANSGLMHPSNLVQTGKGNLLLLLTRVGGHVGWPMGWWPSKYQWQFMSTIVSSFVEAIQATL